MPHVTEGVGDIFGAPSNSVLLHACNCKGTWGNGVAKAFRLRFPAAYEVYHEYCKSPATLQHQKLLLGTTLLIPPQEADVLSVGTYWIACLFTSFGYGRGASKPDIILESTRNALQNLRKRLDDATSRDEVFGDLWAVRMNNGLFKIKWERTREALERSGLDIHVVYPEAEEEAEGQEGLTEGL